jgi:nitrate/nitrite-specific signal transduction histidine kinase
MIANINKSLNSSSKESSIKQELYKDLSKKVERYRHLPKLKMNNREYAALYEPSYQSIDYHNIDDEAHPIESVSYHLFRLVRPSKTDRDSSPRESGQNPTTP